MNLRGKNYFNQFNADMLLHASDGNNIPIHKDLLIQHSKVFKELFNIDANLNEYRLEYTTRIINYVLQYIYTGFIELGSASPGLMVDIIMPVILFSDEFHMPMLAEYMIGPFLQNHFAQRFILEDFFVQNLSTIYDKLKSVYNEYREDLKNGELAPGYIYTLLNPSAPIVGMYDYFTYDIWTNSPITSTSDLEIITSDGQRMFTFGFLLSSRSDVIRDMIAIAGREPLKLDITSRYLTKILNYLVTSCIDPNNLRLLPELIQFDRIILTFANNHRLIFPLSPPTSG